MSKTLDFIFDFASPNAYLVYKALPAILERTNASLNVIPCLLGGLFKSTGNQAPMLAFQGIKGKLEYDQLEIQRFIAKHELLKFKFNPHFPVNTLLLMRGAIAAQSNGQLEQYITVGLTSMWEQGLKMDDPQVYQQAMTDAGLDGQALLESTQNPQVKAKLMANTAEAVARGAFGIPTFYVGDEMFFGKERLQQIEEELSA
ncbi:2-hydroxychromene-2-carboxylate isomerase [Congregibacter variabilis]|uniref:2-hydroxychromene-2-carboxylate isomerase n=1 Tax=Congregibacter variabilis TaxID=3081200 RepID=A0ABZ0I6I9_9GAMM|nr:2-hydroxychromene-2-carboxylate isomerase [Congregibacter sp. IMCC43200]